MDEVIHGCRVIWSVLVELIDMIVSRRVTVEMSGKKLMEIPDLLHVEDARTKP